MGSKLNKLKILFLINLILITLVPASYFILEVDAQTPIYIRFDGTIEPSTAPILRNGEKYSLIEDIITDSEGIVVERSGITLDGLNHKLTGIGQLYQYGIILNGVDQVTIKSLEIENFDSGIYLLNSSQNIVENNTIINNTYRGINFHGLNNENLIRNNLVSGNQIAFGPWFDGDIIDSIFTDNEITNNGVGFGTGLEGHSWINNTIKDNLIANNSGPAISFISYKSPTRGNIIDGNEIRDNGLGISFLMDSDTTIINNIISENSGIGIYCDQGGLTNAIISGNTIEENFGGILITAGFPPGAFASNNIINENIISGNEEYGILLIGASRNNITNNKIFDSKVGLKLTFRQSAEVIYHYSNNNKIIGNQIANCSNYGIQLTQANDNQIYHNSFENEVQFFSENSVNSWDDNLSGGNYWSDYSGTDNDENGIGDSPYIIDENNVDNYPLMNPTSEEFSNIEIVTGGYYNDGTNDYAQITVWNSKKLAYEGVTNWMWLGDTVINCVSKADIDNDGVVEIVAGGKYNDGINDHALFTIWNSETLAYEGSSSWMWISDTVINSLELRDIDDDNVIEIVAGGSFNDGIADHAQITVWNGETYAYEKSTNWIWIDDTIINCLAIEDIDGDGTVEIVSAGKFNDRNNDHAQISVWNGESLTYEKCTHWIWKGDTVVNSINLADVDRDGAVEIITGGSFNDGTSDHAQISLWNGENLVYEGSTHWIWTNNTVINSIITKDVDEDGIIEIITGGSFNDATNNHAQITVWNGETLSYEEEINWMWISDTTISSLTLEDIDDDNSIEIIASGCSNDENEIHAQITVWNSKTLSYETFTQWCWVSNTSVNSIVLIKK